MTKVTAFARLPLTARIADALRDHAAHRAVGGLWGSSAALFVAALEQLLARPMLIVCSDDDDAERLALDLATFSTRRNSLLLPARRFDVDGLPEPNAEGARARCLSDLADHGPEYPFRLLACLESLLQPAPDVKALRAGRLRLRTGELCDQLDLLKRCRDAGLREVPVVLAPGEVSRRGDVLDVFPLAATEALRLEFFDDELESIRVFDPASQRSRDSREEALLQLGGAASGGVAATQVLTWVSRPDLIVLYYEPLRIDERRQALLALGGSEARTAVLSLQETLAPRATLELSSLPSQDLDYKILSAGSAVGSGETDPVGRLRAIRGLQRDVVDIVCRSDGERGRLEEIFAHKQVDLGAERVRLSTGSLTRGFRVPDLGWTVLSNVEFAGVPAPTRIERPKLPSRAIQSFFELGPGDVVVHAAHGIAVFEGIERVTRGESEEDHLRLLFHGDVHLLVPVSKVHLVQKYVGTGSAARPKLDRLGGRGFQRRKDEVQKALYDLASDLLEVQAQRASRCDANLYARDPLEAEFLDGFPFEDTPDQRESWTDIRAELEGDRPMDRLLCGDVGFGKTEVAMRAAFKVAITGRQVAILVPTTVLAEQHGRTFSQRFEPHGLRVEVISRFVPAKQRKLAVEGAAAGQVDVLVGTHRLLGKDVAFQNLGLVIVDEEQRFGVRQKEHLKKLRTGVDLLALSATPIPRTLHASLLGLRQISTLSTPPAGRQDVETKVCFRDDALLHDAIARELARDGQVYVLHDRIAGLQSIADRIHELLPAARIAIGHGQMNETQLDKELRRFVRGDADVLVCTSIVENGIDLPRANTILIDRAEMFGLAELHQLRGRVGRSSAKAWCYLMMDRLKPPPEAARNRLKTLEEFSNLGAGFAIAMKDLEIRGAGNLLGPQQSGHIAAVGYEMLCQLLQTAVAQARHTASGEPGLVLAPAIHEVDVDMQVKAFLPDQFAVEPKARLEILRQMDGAVSPDRAAEIRSDLSDRFGHLPAPVENLLRVFLLKHLLQEHGVLSIQRTGPDRVVVRHPPAQPLGGGWLDIFADTRTVEAGKTHLILPERRGRQQADWTGEQALQLLLDALCGADLCDRPELPKIGVWEASAKSRRPGRRGPRRSSARS